MKYVRFQGRQLIEGCSSKVGIFQLAYELKYAAQTTMHHDKELRKNLTWLETHLAEPTILERAEHYRAICWFKDTAHEPLKRIWSIKLLLEEYGVWVDCVKTASPGNVIYQDGWQIAAKPRRVIVKG